MQPVAHVIAYYEYKLLAEYLADAPNIPTSSNKLKAWINHYEILNAHTWLDELKHEHEIPFDPPYRTKTLRNEDAYNKLLEAGVIDQDGKPID